MRTLTSYIYIAVATATDLGCANADRMPSDPVEAIGGRSGSEDTSNFSGNTGVVTSGGATSAANTSGGAETRGGATSIVRPSGGASTINPPKGGSDSTDIGTGGSNLLVGGRGNRGGAAAGGRVNVGGATTGGAAGRSSTRVATGGKAEGGTDSSVPVASAGTPAFGEKFVGNITTGNNGIDSNGLKFATYWSQISPENSGKWGSVQSNAGSSFNWTALDSVYNYTKTNNIIFKEHCFLWGSQQPGGTIDENAVKTWMTEFCKRYPNVKLIDVVNEPPPHTTPSYANSIGGGTNGDWKWIANAFKWAREACPNAILILNDYNNIEWSGDNSHFIDIVKKIKALNAPIDAIGAQSHDLDNGSVSLNTVKSLLAKLNSDTGLPIYITEMDISTTDDAQQLKLFQQYFPLFMDAEYVKGITIWGWIYGSTWSQAPNSGLVKSGKSRSAMTWLMQQLGRPAP